MNTRAIFTHYKALLDSMLDSSMWIKTWLQSPSWLDNPIEGGKSKGLPSNVILNDGAMRVCLVDSDYDYVVKFDIEEDDCGSACEREEALYAAAVEVGLEKYLNELVYIGCYTRTFHTYAFKDVLQNCHVSFSAYDERKIRNEVTTCSDKIQMRDITISLPLYACRRAKRYDCGPINNDLVSRAQKIYSPLREKQIAVATAFIREYGEEGYVRFSDFAIENDINDLHQGNVGMVGTDMCFIDYAGYHREEDENEF